jgi:ketosteroid isomerase-like protein
MPHANVDLVRSICAARERGDSSSAGWAHPEIEFVIADEPAPASWRGLAGMAEGYGGFLSAWEDVRTKADAYCGLDGERVLVLLHTSGRGKTSGLELGQMWTKSAVVFHVRGGKVTRLLLYFDRGRALGDLGCAPEAGS